MDECIDQCQETGLQRAADRLRRTAVYYINGSDNSVLDFVGLYLFRFVFGKPTTFREAP